jgi:hypothetical protein
MVTAAPWTDHDVMAKAIRLLAVILTTVVALFLLWMASVFGSCEGWKGTGTCPRVPLWEWEVFWLGFWAGVFPAAAIRLGRNRLVRGLGEALTVGVLLGAAMVVATGY